MCLRERPIQPQTQTQTQGRADKKTMTDKFAGAACDHLYGAVPIVGDGAAGGLIVEGRQDSLPSRQLPRGDDLILHNVALHSYRIVPTVGNLVIVQAFFSPSPLAWSVTQRLTLSHFSHLSRPGPHGRRY